MKAEIKDNIEIIEQCLGHPGTVEGGWNEMNFKVCPNLKHLVFRDYVQQ